MNETWWISEGQLDADQQEVVSLGLDKSFLISGPPGSGKTNLLLLRAKYLTLAGHSNLQIVLFTRALREFIASGAEKYAISAGQVRTSHNFWSHLLYEYGEARPTEQSFEDQRRALVEAVTKIVSREKLNNIYDAILLDEAHDFWPEEIELFAKLGKTIFAVVDQRQKIYSGESPFLVLDSVTDQEKALRYHYRNGTNICRFADLVGRDSDSYQSITPTSNYDEKSRPSTMASHSCTSLNNELDLMFKKLEDQLKAYPDELIGIISPSKDVTSQAFASVKDRGYGDLASFAGSLGDLSFSTDCRVCVSTLHAAKGLEFRALHVLGCEHFRRRPLPRRLVFTAVTRAKTTLDLYYSDDLLGFLDSAILSIGPTPETPRMSDLF